MRRSPFRVVVALFVAGILLPAPARAQQSLNLFLGGFTPRALDGRSDSDVLVQNGMFLSTLNRSSGVDVGRFNYPTIGGEWLFGVGRMIDGGMGLSFYQHAVPLVDTYNVNGLTGGDVDAQAKLRILPFSATVRLLPFGRGGFEPYIGGGVNVYYWRYSETGQFVDYGRGAYGPCPNCAIIQANSVGSGGAVGPVVMGGFRIPFEALAVGGELRWQGGRGTLPTDQGFAGSKIDLGGMSYLATFSVKF